jgi:hypothetical protein
MISHAVGLKNARDQIRVGGMVSQYWDMDELKHSNMAWNAIQAGHGVVALTPEFIATHNLPDSIHSEEDPSKKLYAIESYHMMHCVVSKIRRQPLH